MFGCKTCKTLEEGLRFERERNKDLMNRVMALSNPDSLAASQFKYDEKPPENDEYIDYNEFGEEILVKRK